MKPTIASLRAQIEALQAEVKDADECAARALEGRDKAFKECLQLEAALKRQPQFMPDRRYEPLVRAHEALRLELQIAKAEIRLLRLRLRRRDG